MNDITCLFSVENLHDQPENNLVKYWHNDPSLEALVSHFSCDFKNDKLVLSIVKLYSGETVRIDEFDYRLEKLSEGAEPCGP